jgi:hypothetical protein
MNEISYVVVFSNNIFQKIKISQIIINIKKNSQDKKSTI